MAESSKSIPAHLTDQTALTPTLNAWEMYMNDQGRSPHTVKAFLSDIRLLAEYLQPDQSIGKITTNDLTKFLQWLENGRGIPCSPKSLARRITSLK